MSGVLAAALAAASAVWIVDSVLTAQGNRRLTGAVDVLAGELEEDLAEGDSLGVVVDDENSELVTSGVRLAVFSGSERVAGDAWVPLVAAGRCRLRGAVGGRVRACAGAYRELTLVAAAEADSPAIPLAYLVAGLTALFVGAAAAALASARSMRWALRPLTDLTRTIRTLEPGVAGGARLGGPTHCEETELVREALSELLARVDSLLGQARRFAADAAHELGNPLTTIRAELELLLEDRHEAATRAALQRTVARVERLGALLERLLVLAAPVEGLAAGGPAVSLAEVLDTVLDELPAADQARVHLEVRGDGLVRGDSALLHAMVANAVGNALKFSGTEPVKVSLDDGPGEASGAAPAQVILSCRDRGPGVPPELRERVFEAFYRAQPDATPGHGLGLALIGHIARAHGGDARFVDQEVGACLRLTLPAWREAETNET